MPGKANRIRFESDLWSQFSFNVFCIHSREHLHDLIPRFRVGDSQTRQQHKPGGRMKRWRVS